MAAKTHWTAFRSGIWPTDNNTAHADNDDEDTRGLLGSKHRYHQHILAVQASRHRTFCIIRPRVAQRLACVILILVCLQFWLLHSAYSEALAEKYSPTLFTRLTRQDEDLLASTRWQLRAGDQNAERQALLQNRAQWKSLGSGYEGDTFAYNGSVIKVFKPGRSPLRNCVPNILANIQWPPEIPVSLLLGGLRDEQHQQHHHHNYHISTTASAPSDFVPVLDYFLLPTPRSSHPGEWYLVTPFLRSGTLEHLAKSLRLQHQDNPLTPEDVDARFRPSFNRLLRALDVMHMEHDLCHDDIKMDNIFVTKRTSSFEKTANASATLPEELEDAHWLIADLGNARQPSHEYHYSLLWTHDNDQHIDCRVNDVVRLVKSYMFFLQSASSSRKAAFHDQFLTASAPWSQLYWYSINSAHQALLDGSAVAQSILHVSSNAFPPSTTAGEELHSQIVPVGMSDSARNDGIHGLAMPNLKIAWGERLWSGLGNSAHKAFMLRRELHSGMSVSEKWAKMFGTMGLLPTPHNTC